MLSERDQIFRESFCQGREWLAEFIAECRKDYDEKRENYLRWKKHPARKAADVVKEIKAEKRDLIAKLKFLEYQLKSYEDYFPFLEEYRNIIVDEEVQLRSGGDNIVELEKVDPVRLYLDKDQYEKRSSIDRNQLALDRYLRRQKSNWEIGRMYERYIGYLYESDGWKVVYHGAVKGFEDFGRDLICTRNSLAQIIQAKCWSKDKLIR